jgi:hypothetical protein
MTPIVSTEHPGNDISNRTSNMHRRSFLTDRQTRGDSEGLGVSVLQIMDDEPE